jgi:imidazolonepropionase
MAFLAATTMGLPCESALLAITRHAARALGCTDGEGTVRAGAVADLVVHDASDWRELLYHFGTTHARDVLVAGRRVLSER